jgi:acyl-CoA thioesterase
VTQSNAFRLDIPFIRDLGVEYISAENGTAVLALNITERHLNSWAVAHGGVLMSLLDVAMALAGRTVFGDTGAAVTVEMKTSFLQPAKAQSRLTATARAFHRSSTMAFCEAEARDENARLIAKAMGTFKYHKSKTKTDV